MLCTNICFSIYQGYDEININENEEKDEKMCVYKLLLS